MVVALICLGFADLEISTLDPWDEFSRMFYGLLTPEFSFVYETRTALFNTVAFALCGTFLGVVFGAGLAFCFHVALVRWFCAFIRSIHEIFWAFIFLYVVGLNPVCGIFAIAIPYAGIFAKVYAEILQESDHHPLEALPHQSSFLSRFFFGILPIIYADLKHYTSYRFECALRSSTILGFVGLPTLGYHLETMFREGMYSEAAALLYCFFLLIASLKYLMRPRLVLLYVVFAFAFISTDIAFSWENFTRFFTYEILPWPMRREGMIDGTHAVVWGFNGLWTWFTEIWYNEALEGIWNTLLLTQIVLVVSGVLALLAFPLVCLHFTSWLPRKMGRYLLIILRTTPEYVMAYLLVQWFGPSFLPAIIALGFHNGAILGHLIGGHADMLKLQRDVTLRKLERYFFEVLPRVYGQFLAFLFYRWEVMMRESAILGILGIYTLGFYIDSAIAEDQLDKAFLLILITAVLNICIDAVSQQIRKRLKISTKLQEVK